MLTYGRSAVLIEVDTADEAAALHTRLAARPVDGTIEIMPGLHTVLIRFDPALTDATRLALQLATVSIDTGSLVERGDDVWLRVDYAGPDLDEVAAHTGLSTSEVVAAHQARTYRIVLIGMAPGFYFLAGGDPRLRVPRRFSPRVEVPKGAVGLAGEFTGIYPRSGPGGWQLIGRTVDELWHSSRLPAAKLSLGTAIRFAAA